MKIKESYTLEELCTGLTMPLVKFCQMASITEATLIRLRKGYAGRQHTINLILATFSQIYGIEFSLENVEGLTVQEKPHQKGKKPSVSPNPIAAIPQKESSQNRIVEPKKEKRIYTRKKESDLPDGCILGSEFALAHNVNRRTFVDHMIIGKGPGTVPGEETHPTLPVKDHVDYSEREHPSRQKETIKYLTPEQQAGAIRFWQKWKVSYSQCDRPECPCH